MTDEENKLLKILYVLRDSDPRQDNFRFQADIQARILKLQLQAEKALEEEMEKYIDKRIDELSGKKPKEKKAI